MLFYFKLSVLLLSLVSIVACDNGSQSNSQSVEGSNDHTGSVAFQINWPDTYTSSSYERHAKIDCSANDVDTISAKVWTGEEKPIVGGPWPCSEGRGTISQVPGGKNYTVALHARDGDGNMMSYGQANKVCVRVAQEATVDVQMSHVVVRSVSLVENVNSYADTTFPHSMFESKGQLYLIGQSPDTGHEIFVSDPVEGGVRLLKDIYLDNDELDRYGLMAPSGFAESNAWIYFQAHSASGVKLWRTDGTTANTEPITSTTEYFNPTEIKALNEHIFFVADSLTTGKELWVYDENSSQITVKDIIPGENGSNPNQLTVVGDTLFFVADDGDHGYEIWSIDTTEAIARLAEDLDVGTNDVGTRSSYPRELTDVGGRLFFIADDGPQRPEGTPPTHGMEIWMMYETPQGIESQLTADLNMTDMKNGARDIKNLTWLYDTTLAFSVHLEQTGQELYLYDWQTDTAPRRITDLNPGPGSSHPANIVYLNGTIYFTASNANLVEHLWAYSVQGLQPEPITKNIEHPSPRNLTVFNQTLYFTASNKSNLRNLWAYDGSRTGLVMGNTNETETTQHSPANLIATEDRLYYSAFDKDYGVKLFQILDP